MKKQVLTPAKAAPAVGPYHPAVKYNDLLFASGQIPVNPEAPQAAFPDTVEAQTRQVCENIRILLDDQNLSFAHVLKTTVFLTDMADFAAMNTVYAEYFTEAQPARSTIQVAALPLGAKVEIEFVAHY